MKKETRFKFNGYLTQLAKLNNVSVSEVTAKYTVEPSVSQTLENKIQESSSFLQKINIVPVDEQSGQRLGLGITGPIASTTDTTQGERTAIDPTFIDGDEYKCTQTNSDTLLRYEKLDLWAKYKDFQTRIRNAIVERQALDRIMIGWNGVKREKTSNKLLYPLLQDVNIGWLEKIRRESPIHVFDKIIGENGTVASATIKIGKNGHFKNLDALVLAAVSEKIASWYQEDTQLVAITGSALMADKYFPIVNRDQPNSEALAADMLISQKRIGQKPAVQVPFFPANAILITRLDNLSIYWQDGSRRRAVIDNPKRDAVENFESVNEAYVIEDYDCACLIENIEILDDTDASVDAQGAQPGVSANSLSEDDLIRIAAIAAQVVQTMNTSNTSADGGSSNAPVDGAQGGE